MPSKITSLEMFFSLCIISTIRNRSEPFIKLSPGQQEIAERSRRPATAKNRGPENKKSGNQSHLCCLPCATRRERRNTATRLGPSNPEPHRFRQKNKPASCLLPL